MSVPPPNARSTGVLFERRATTYVIGERCGDPLMKNVSEPCVEMSDADHARLFGFESELETSLTYIPMAVRFKLDKCGIKLSLGAWQQLSEGRRCEFLHAPCEQPPDIASYRLLLCSSVRECTGQEPPLIPVAEHPPWAEKNIPEQLTKAVTELSLPPLSAARWCKLTPLQRFALVKLSREGREHRNLGPALREFGLLSLLR